MEDYIVTADATVDMGKEYLDSNNVPYVSLTYLIDDVVRHDFDLTSEQFYKLLDEGKMPTTSQVNEATYEEFFNEQLKQGKDILHIGFSSGLSGSVNSAKSAAKKINETSAKKVYVVDTLCASAGQGLMLQLVLDNKKNGMSLQDNIKFIEDTKENVNHWFTVTNLETLIRGGRVSKVAGYAAKMLNICPVLRVDYHGRLETFEKVRMKKKALERLVSLMEENADNGLDYDGYAFISNAGCLEDANYVKELVEKKFPKLKQPVSISDIGSIIGAHTGRGCVTLFFVGSNRNKYPERNDD